MWAAIGLVFVGVVIGVVLTVGAFVWLFRNFSVFR